MPIALTADRGLLFRITHIANLPWLLANGLYASKAALVDPGFVSIGNPDLIERRNTRPVPIPPGGTLSDYIPFYLTPKSPMLLNIKTGFHGIVRRPNDEIVILVSSCRSMESNGVTIVYTDRHAYTAFVNWTANSADLATLVDWDILRRHDFARSDEYPEKMERYQAEALAHMHIPPAALLGIGYASEIVRPKIEACVRDAASHVKVFLRPGWFF